MNVLLQNELVTRVFLGPGQKLLSPILPYCLKPVQASAKLDVKSPSRLIILFSQIVKYHFMRVLHYGVCCIVFSRLLVSARKT
jgi:hypothetical protein